MRISDWSSDVCSSDLRCPDAIADLHQRPEDHRLAQRLCAAAAERGPGPACPFAGCAEDPHRLDRECRPGCGFGDHQEPAEFAGGQLRDHPRHSAAVPGERSEEHTSELQSLMRTSYAVLCLKQKK